MPSPSAYCACAAYVKRHSERKKLKDDPRSIDQASWTLKIFLFFPPIPFFAFSGFLFFGGKEDLFVFEIEIGGVGVCVVRVRVRVRVSVLVFGLGPGVLCLARYTYLCLSRRDKTIALFVNPFGWGCVWG
jgi:hypothetical protein